MTTKEYFKKWSYNRRLFKESKTNEMNIRYRVCPHATKKIDELLQEANRVVDLGKSATEEERLEAKAKEREILERIAKIDPALGERLMPKG